MYGLTPAGKEGKQDLCCSLTDTTVQYSTDELWVVSVCFTLIKLTFPFSLLPSGEAVNES